MPTSRQLIARLAFENSQAMPSSTVRPNSPNTIAYSVAILARRLPWREVRAG